MKRVLILTLPLHNNYGGLLQAFALQKVVKSLGYEVIINNAKLQAKPKITVKRVVKFGINIAKRIVKTILRYRTLTSQQYKIIAQNTSRFVNQYIDNQHIEYLSEKEVNEFDIFIVGSDQVFRKRWSNVTKYFLEDLKVRNDKIKLAYAASFGTDDLSEWSQEEIEICKTLALKFKAISVREDSGVEIFKKYFDTNAEHVLDPTLLLNKEDYLETIEKEDESTKSNVLMCYILDKTPEKSQIINTIKDRLKLQPLDVMPEEIFKKNTKDISKCIYPSVSKWLAGFRDASFVVTDSFHGTVFSIIFNKPFICVGNKLRGLTRFTSLLKIFRLEDRLVFSLDDFSEKLLVNIDYEKINIIKQQWQVKSISFLEENLM